MPTIALSTVITNDYAEIYDSGFAALKMLVVGRGNLAKVNTDEWNAPGFYILISGSNRSNGCWNAYVGKAPAGIKKRVSQHVNKKDFWDTAIMVRKDTSNGFSSAEAGWLEARFYELLEKAHHCELENTVKPVEDTLPSYTVEGLERATQPVLALLRLMGYDTRSSDCDRKLSQRAKAATNVDSAAGGEGFTGASLKELLDGNFVLPGKIISLEKKYPGEAWLNADGTVLFQDVTYATPSGAGLACRRLVRPESTSPNGWDFWGMEDEEGVIKSLASFRSSAAGSPE